MQLFMELAVWARDNPAMFARVRRLEAAKVTVLVRLRPDLLELLLSRREHVVPSSGRRTTLEVMKVAEFMEVVGALTNKPPVPKEGSVEAIITESRGAARKAIRSIAMMIEHKDEISPEMVEDFHDDLAAALVALAKAFALDDE